MADIFLSYADEDRLRAGTVVEALRDGGRFVWWSGDLAIGTAYRREIQEQLRAATCVVVLWSNASISSDWVIDEAEEGKTCRRDDSNGACGHLAIRPVRRRRDPRP